MPKPFDATLKELIRAFPADWLGHVGGWTTATWASGSWTGVPGRLARARRGAGH